MKLLSKSLFLIFTTFVLIGCVNDITKKETLVTSLKALLLMYGMENDVKNYCMMLKNLLGKFAHLFKFTI